MNKSLLAIVSTLILTIGSFVYSNSSFDNVIEERYLEWKKQFGIGESFTYVENLYRMKIFNQNLQQIKEHNSLKDKTYEMGVNQFTHLTPEEFAEQYLSTFEKNPNYDQIQIEEIPNGPVVDWVKYGAVSPVKYQGSCTATYAFSAIGAIEGVSVIFFKNQQEYSVQQVIDCSQSYGNNGCYNGRMDNTFNYAKAIGVNLWSSYPYVGYAQSCKASSGYFRVNGSVAVGDCNSLANALIGRPISVAVDGQNFQSYKTGIFKNCGTNLSLAVLLVGMTDTYWTLKNSWGTSWGQNGYIRISRGNTCGVCMAASYPTV